MPGRVNPCFLFQKLVVSVKFKASFQNKMTGCALKLMRVMSALWCNRTTFKRTCQNLLIRVLGKVSKVIIMGERVEVNQQNEVFFFLTI